MQKTRERSRRSKATSGPRTQVVSPDVAEMNCSDLSSLMGQRRFAEAESLLREALRIRPDDADVVNKLGTVLWEQGRVVEAETFFVRANQLNPGDGVILTT